MDPSQLPESGTFASLEEYVEFAGLDEEGAAGEGITVLVEDGNKLVYEYIYDIPSDQTEMYQETLAAAMDSMADTFTSLIGVIDGVVDVEGLTLVVRYVNSDGSVIYSQEYTAE